MNTLYQLVNVFNKAGKWLGQFKNEDTAKSWLKSQKLDIDEHEISRRRPEWSRGGRDEEPRTDRC